MKNQLEEYAGNTKLHLLCQLDRGRPWQSLDDTRHCILCERTISGRGVRIIKDRHRKMQALRCPTRGCVGSPTEWVHPENPLLSEDAWLDWVRLLDSLCDEETSLTAPTRRRLSGVLRR